MAAGNAVAGGIGQAATDAAGDPLAGLGAGLIAPSVAHAGLNAGGNAVGRIAKPVVMGIPGIDNVPLVGPVVAAARDNAAAQS